MKREGEREQEICYEVKGKTSERSVTRGEKREEKNSACSCEASSRFLLQFRVSLSFACFACFSFPRMDREGEKEESLVERNEKRICSETALFVALNREHEYKPCTSGLV